MLMMPAASSVCTVYRFLLIPALILSELIRGNPLPASLNLSCGVYPPPTHTHRILCRLVVVGSLFNDAFTVSRLYSVDDRIGE
jgi:hypothetical protein